MSILDRVLARPTQPTNMANLEDPTYPISGEGILEALRWPHETSSTVRVNEHRSLAMPAVWRAVNLIAGGAASLPLNAYKQVTGDDDDTTVRKQVTSGAAFNLLATPHPDLTRFELLELVFAHMALWGNAYLQKLRTPEGRLAELWPIHPSRVRPGRAPSDLSKIYELDGERPMTDRQILHLPGFGYDGTMGLSPIQMARQGIGLALAAEEFGSKLFGSGSMASGVLQTKQRLTPTQAEALKDRWQARVGGLDNAHKIAVLDAGAEFNQLTIPPEDAQFIQSRGFQIDEVARIFGIPPHMLMAVDKSTSWGTGIEQQSIGFVTYTLRPWLTRVEQRFTSILKPEPVYASFNTDGLIRGDLPTRYAGYNQALLSGWLNRDEVRAKEEMPPIPDGKGQAYYTPANMSPADAAAAAPAPDDLETTDAA